MTELSLWNGLRRYTSARVALGRVGNAIPTAGHLAFQAAHAAARDAVHAPLDTPGLVAEFCSSDPGETPRVVASLCPDRATYLLRPDLGRKLAEADREALAAAPCPGRIAFLICDGLSAVAVQRHAAPFVALVRRGLADPGPVVIAAQGRVALGDEVGAALGASAIVVLIGERPGLSTADSMGVYLTFAPRPGRTDADRNCISNIHGNGLSVDTAAEKLLWLIGEMRRLQITGVALKDQHVGRPSLHSSGFSTGETDTTGIQIPR